jgi:hypothetical protein
MRKGRLTASILQEVRNTMEDIVKHRITKTAPWVAKVLVNRKVLTMYQL